MKNPGQGWPERWSGLIDAAQRSSFSGAGCCCPGDRLSGALLGLFFQVIISHTPGHYDMRIRGFYGMLIISSSLAAIVIETTRQLQAGSSDPPITAIGGG